MLQVNQLTGFGAVKFRPILSYIGYNENTLNQTTAYTFSNVPIGNASSDRLVIVAVFGWEDGPPSNTPTMTIGGVSATQVVTAAGQTNNDVATTIFSLLVTSGTTANFSIQFPTRQLGMGFFVYTLTGYSSSTAVETDSTQVLSTTSTSFTTTVTEEQAGIVLGAQYHNIGSGTATLTNALEDFEFIAGDGNGTAVVGKLTDGILTRTITWSSTADVGMVAAVWQ